MESLLSTLFLLVACALALAIVIRGRFSPRAHGWIWLAFCGHFVASIAQVIITRDVYEGGDMFLYYEEGLMLADLMRADFGRYFPLVLDLAAGGQPFLPVEIIGAGSTTGGMSAICGLLLLVSFDSLYGACILFGMFAFSGQLTAYLAVRDAFPRELHQRMLIAALLVPSVVYWSSGVLKEPLALAGIGWAALGFRMFAFQRRHLAGAVAVAAGAAVIAISKPYILFPLAIACAAWFYWHRSSSGPRSLSRRLLYLAVCAGFAFAALYYLGEAYPRYSVSNFAESAADLQYQYSRIESAGSTFSYGAASSQQQLYYAPLALLTALFRPLVFEAHNAMSLINAVETTVVAFLVVLILARSRHKIGYIFRSPTAVFMLVFVLLLATAVGLGAPNLGSLSRYRIPLMPFWAMLIVVLLPTKRRRRPALA